MTKSTQGITRTGQIFDHPTNSMTITLTLFHPMNIMISTTALAVQDES